MDPHGRAVIGYKVSETNPVGDCVPLTISRSPAHLYLSVLHTLGLDESPAGHSGRRSPTTGIGSVVHGMRALWCQFGQAGVCPA